MHCEGRDVVRHLFFNENMSGQLEIVHVYLMPIATNKVHHNATRQCHDNLVRNASLLRYRAMNTVKVVSC